jgi:hypothetical protein
VDFEEIIVAIRLGRSKRVTQLTHDGTTLNGIHLLSVGGYIESVDSNGVKTSRPLCITPSFVVVDQTAESAFSGIKMCFERGKEKLRLLIEEAERRGLDWQRLGIPRPEDLDMRKCAYGCCMNDNCNTAKSTADMVKDHVVFLIDQGKEYDETSNEIDGENEEEEELMLKFGCAAHIRDLIQKSGILHEHELMLEWFSDVDPEALKKQRINPDNSDLIYAVQKEFSNVKDNYQRGKADDLAEYAKREFPRGILLSMGRAGTGNRFDAKLKDAMALFINKNIYINFFLGLENGSGLTTMLDTSVFDRLVCKEVQAALRSRAIFWYIMFQPYRCVTNGKEAVLSCPVEVYDMGLVYDMLERELQLLVDSDEAREDFIRGNFRDRVKIFDETEFPCLKKFYSGRKLIQRSTLDGEQMINLDQYIRSHIFDCSDPDINVFTKRAVKDFAEGALEGEIRLASDWLTSKNGKFSHGKWSSRRKARYVGVDRTNIQHGESPFAMVDYTDGLLQNADIATVGGISMSRQNHTFDGGEGILPFAEEFSFELLQLVVECAFQNHDLFKGQREGDIAKQKQTRYEEMQQRMIKSKTRLKMKQLETLGYFNLQQVSSMSELRRIMDELSSNQRTLKMFLVHQIRSRVDGRGLPSKYRRPFSKMKDAYVGSPEDLSQRMQELFDLQRSQPQLFNIAEAPNTILPEMRNILHGHCTEAILEATAVQQAHLLNETFNTYNKYAPTLRRQWKNVAPYKWSSNPLTEQQKRFPRGAIFSMETDRGRKTFISHGLLYRVDSEDYDLVCECNPPQLGTFLEDEIRIFKVPFTSTPSRPGLDKIPYTHISTN